MPTIPNGYFSDIYRLRLGATNISPSTLKIGSSKIKNLYVGGDRIYHPEALNWVNNAQSNGGSVSFQTLDAVSDFCYSIDYAGIRDRFSRLNLFCGNNLAAALVPLYRYFDTSDTLGGDTDTNYSFVAGDYGYTTGLTGDGSNKALLIGLSSETSAGGVSTFYNSHLSVYALTDDSGGNVQYALGCTDSNNFIGTYLNFNDYGANAPFGTFSDWDTYAGGNGQTNNLGFTLSTTNGTNRKIYRNNTDITANSNNNGSGGDIADIGIFGYYDPAYSVSDPLAYYAGALGAYSIGKYLTSSQVSTFYSIIQQCQTALGRNA